MGLSLNVKKTECLVISKKSFNPKCNLVSKALFRSLKSSSRHKSSGSTRVRPPPPSTPPPLPPYPPDLPVPPLWPLPPSFLEREGGAQELGCPPLPPRPDDLEEVDPPWLPPPPCDLATSNVVTLEHPESVEGDIYDDGSSVPQHPLLCHPWFHEDATRKTGDSRVMQIKQEGAFLVRPSSKEDSYVLVVFSGGKTCNLPIALRRDGQYALGTEKPEEKRFESVAALIDHHLHCKITLSQGGHVILTKHARRQ
ncbi:B-cell linker protein [Plakobranchus ocellatus]|uniref:B-cell linker protein n=1 Tax=Plakobranchus ocellatus TaxID=259542 RepID=A0AAV3YEE1_9GAST|nr:B-cell linker protein [Plakobranchus ocellatus]